MSSRAYGDGRNDVVIMALTGRVRSPLGFAEAIVIDWQAAGLIKTSAFKPVFATIEQSLIVRKMGDLSAADVRTLLALAVG